MKRHQKSNIPVTTRNQVLLGFSLFVSGSEYSLSPNELQVVVNSVKVHFTITANRC